MWMLLGSPSLNCQAAIVAQRHRGFPSDPLQCNGIAGMSRKIEHAPWRGAAAMQDRTRGPVRQYQEQGVFKILVASGEAFDPRMTAD